MCAKFIKLQPIVQKPDEERYRAVDVAAAIGKTTCSVQNYITQILKKKSSKEGMTIQEVARYIEYMKNPDKRTIPNQAKVQEIIKRLEDECLIRVVNDDEDLVNMSH